MTAMAALAGRTRRIKFGMNVLSLALRDPVLVAKQCATIDVLSEGRLLPAFGIGSPLAPEWTALQRRHARRAAARPTRGWRSSRRLWREDSVDFAGEHYHLSGASISPKPVQPDLPMWIGGSSEAAIRRTARFGTGWQAGPGDAGRKPRRIVAAIQAAAAEAGRSIDDDHYGAGFPFHFGRRRRRRRCSARWRPTQAHRPRPARLLRGRRCRGDRRRGSPTTSTPASRSSCCARAVERRGGDGADPPADRARCCRGSPPAGRARGRCHLREHGVARSPSSQILSHPRTWSEGPSLHTDITARVAAALTRMSSGVIRGTMNTLGHARVSVEVLTRHTTPFSFNPRTSEALTPHNSPSSASVSRRAWAAASALRASRRASPGIRPYATCARWPVLQIDDHVARFRVRVGQYLGRVLAGAARHARIAQQLHHLMLGVFPGPRSTMPSSTARFS